jgi:hypothetical protein
MYSGNLETQQVKNQAPYEIHIKDVSVETADDGPKVATVTFEGRMGVQTASRVIESNEFSDLFECCRLLAKDIFGKEFRLNSAVDLDFELIGENGITVWHTRPSTFLKMPMTMNMHWSCEHMKKNFKSFTSLGLIEMPSEFKLVNGALPLEETLKLMLNSMESGIDFMGMLVLQRDEIDHAKIVATANG